MLSVFCDKADWATVEKKVEATLDWQWLSNVKKEMKRDTEPLGHDFEAVVTFKQNIKSMSTEETQTDLPLYSKWERKKPKWPETWIERAITFSMTNFAILMANENVAMASLPSRQAFTILCLESRFLLL